MMSVQTPACTWGSSLFSSAAPSSCHIVPFTPSIPSTLVPAAGTPHVHTWGPRMQLGI